ncbi:MAG: class I SAM-dependent methyltransferase [Clostridia bacterium]|nr:class I SAM-dependent methyltransferase [Clostridia bacterium]
MDIIQNFYNNLASEYDKLFENWQTTTKEQAVILNKIFCDNGFEKEAKLLDCACGIGTQAIGLALARYSVTASDISTAELLEAKRRAEENKIQIHFEKADFRTLESTFSQRFDIIIAMDNALPHMLTKEDLEKAIKSITNCLAPGGMFVASIRDYDRVLNEKPPYSPPYIHKMQNGQRVCFQTWNWEGDIYNLTQYIIDDDKELSVKKFECKYRAVRREEITNILVSCGCTNVEWKFTEETDFYQPIVIAKK